jgi:hypothetical protein
VCRCGAGLFEWCCTYHVNVNPLNPPNPTHPPTRTKQAPTTTGCDVDPVSRCGFRLDHNVSIYSSWDLSSGSWQFEGYAFPWTERPPGTLFRPSAVYNPNSKEYVLWWNYVHPNGTYAGFAAATADSPVGPFKQARSSVNITYERDDVQAGDLKLFVDDDGTGYGASGASCAVCRASPLRMGRGWHIHRFDLVLRSIVSMYHKLTHTHGTSQAHPHPSTHATTTQPPVIYAAYFWVTIEKLTPDFLGVTGEMFDGFRGNQSEWGFEAPTMFKRRGVYYITFGPFCCFCYQVRAQHVCQAISTFTGRTKSNQS